MGLRMDTDRDEYLIDEALSLAIAVLRLLPADTRPEANIADMMKLLAARQRAGMRVVLEDIAVQRVTSLLVSGASKEGRLSSRLRDGPTQPDPQGQQTALLPARRACVADLRADPTDPAARESRLKGRMTAAELAAERARLEHRLQQSDDAAVRSDLDAVSAALRQRGLLGPSTTGTRASAIRMRTVEDDG